MKRQPSARLVSWIGAQSESDLFISVLTLGEIEKGIAKLPDGRKKSDYARWLYDALPTRFEGRVLPIDTPVALLWGNIQGEKEKRGIKLPVIDSLLAACAMAHSMTIVSRNAQDFARCGAEVLNPW